MQYSQSRTALSQYYYLGANELRGFKSRGCVGNTSAPHMGGSLVATIHQFIHYRLPFKVDSSIFGFINAGILSFKKIQGPSALDCINAAMGVGVSVNSVELNLIKPLLYGPKDGICSFQLTTSV